MKNPTYTEAQQRRAAAATLKSDELSLTLYNLTEIVKLAAFAAEARRTLNEIESTLNYRPEMQQVISDTVSNSSLWATFEDSSGEVLHHVACQLAKVNKCLTDNLYDLARPSGGSTEPENIGGAT